MTALRRSLIIGLALLGVSATHALAAPGTLPACVSIPNGTTVVSPTADANGQLTLPCTPQPGQVLVVVGDNPQAASSPVAGVSPMSTSTPAPLPTSPVDDRLGTMTDPRVDTYAKRQAIRDKYRGQINETTFNDELGDGVSLDQALADAMKEFGK
jgi:hypothetical protein